MLDTSKNLHGLHHRKGWIPRLMANTKIWSLLRPLIDYSPRGRELRPPDSVMLKIAKKFSSLHYWNPLNPRRTDGAKMVVRFGEPFLPRRCAGVSRDSDGVKVKIFWITLTLHHLRVLIPIGWGCSRSVGVTTTIFAPSVRRVFRRFW